MNAGTLLRDGRVEAEILRRAWRTAACCGGLLCVELDGHRSGSAFAEDADVLGRSIELDGHPFALGVQWHPELSPRTSPHGRLFEALCEAAAGALAPLN